MATLLDFYNNFLGAKTAKDAADQTVQADLAKLAADQKAQADAGNARDDAAGALTAVVNKVNNGYVQNPDGSITVLEVSGGTLRVFNPPKADSVAAAVQKNDDGTFSVVDPNAPPVTPPPAPAPPSA